MAAVSHHAGLVIAAEVQRGVSQGQTASSSLSKPGTRIGSSVCLSRRDFAGAQLASNVQRGKSRVTCAAIFIKPATAKIDLLEDLERIWIKCHENPLEGAPFTDEEFAEVLSKYDYDFRQGQKVRGIISQVDNSGAWVEIGAKSPALLPAAEASLYKVKHLEQLGLYEGADNEFEIISEEDWQGNIVLSLRKMQYGFSWERARQLLADDVTVFGTVLNVNRGGLMVSVEGLRGFVPMSMVAMRCPKEELPGKSIALKFLEVEEERSRLVLSNRKAMSSNQAQAFTVGSVVLGTVQSVKPYGAFIDLGGVNGLLHISQISHDRITNVETVLNEGDTIKVLILSHDREKGRLSLSTKKLEPTPGDMLRNPALVFEKAEEMANTFRERVAAAEAAARAEEQRLQQEGYGGFPAIVGGGPWETARDDSFGLDLSGL